MHGVAKPPKIKVNHQISDAILLDSASQVTIFNNKDWIGKIFILKGNHYAHSSDDG